MNAWVKRGIPYLVVAIAIVAAIAVTSYNAPALAQSSVPDSPAVGIASIIDGDTLEIHDQRIRLDGIDAPEHGRRCASVNVGQRAAQALSALTASRTVTCTPSDRPDRYSRMVAHCSVGGEDVAMSLVRQGWARDWPRYSGGEYANAETQARAAGRGLWGLECPADLWGHRIYSR